MLMPRCTSQLAHSDADAPCGNERARRLSTTEQAAPKGATPTKRNNKTDLQREQPERARPAPSVLPSQTTARLRHEKQAHPSHLLLSTRPLSSTATTSHTHIPRSSSTLTGYDMRYGGQCQLPLRHHHRVLSSVLANITSRDDRMVVFSNTECTKLEKNGTPALDFAWMRPDLCGSGGATIRFDAWVRFERSHEWYGDITRNWSGRL